MSELLSPNAILSKHCELPLVEVRPVVRGRQVNEKTPEPLLKRKTALASPSEVLSNGLEPAREALRVCPVG